jgi:hypothetical protein
MTNGMAIIGIVAVVIFIAILLIFWGGGGKKSRYDSDGDDYFHSSHRHNGKMPNLLLAPYRLFGPALFGVGLIIFLITSLLTE